MDLAIFPGSYLPREVDVPVSCGAIEFSKPTVKQTDDHAISIRLSEGLVLQARNEENGLRTNIDLTLKGTVRSQLKDLDFVIAAQRGQPLIIGGTAHTSSNAPGVPDERLSVIRARLARLVELFDVLGLDDSFLESLQLSDKDKRTLLEFHTAFVEDEEVKATADGIGRYDFPIGSFKIVTLVTPGSTEAERRFVDPFDPQKRSELRIAGTKEDGSVEEIHWATVYDSMQVADLATTLNLRLDVIVEAYEALENREVACQRANQMTLNLLSAADSVDGPRRDYLLVGAAALNDWLIANGEETPIYMINRWQIRHRRGDLSSADKKEIRAARRAVLLSGAENAHLREACLAILLDDRDELDLILEGLSDQELGELRSWPIWALADRP
jgi:hypothetical protein